MTDQHEGANTRLHETVCLSGFDPDLFVMAQDHPIIQAGFREPIQIIRTLSEVIVVPLEADPGSCKDLEENTVREICVDEEDRVRRRVFRR